MVFVVDAPGAGADFEKRDRVERPGMVAVGAVSRRLSSPQYGLSTTERRCPKQSLMRRLGEVRPGRGLGRYKAGICRRSVAASAPGRATGAALTDVPEADRSRHVSIDLELLELMVRLNDGSVAHSVRR